MSVKVSVPFNKVNWTPLFFFTNTSLESETLVVIRRDRRGQVQPNREESIPGSLSMMRPNLHRLARRAAMAPLTALLLIPLLGMVAFAVDMGWIVCAE